MTKRFATNHSESFIRCFAMLSMTLPGTPILYYGDEINMVDLSNQPSSSTSRNQPMRGLMQWDNTPNGGFTNGTSPWISVGADYQTNNVKVMIPVNSLFSQPLSVLCQMWLKELSSIFDNFIFQNQSAKGDSLMSFFKNLTTLRSDDTFRIGDYYPTVVDDAVFSFVREFDGKKGYDSPTSYR